MSRLLNRRLVWFSALAGIILCICSSGLAQTKPAPQESGDSYFEIKPTPANPSDASPLPGGLGKSIGQQATTPKIYSATSPHQLKGIANPNIQKLTPVVAAPEKKTQPDNSQKVVAGEFRLPDAKTMPDIAQVSAEPEIVPNESQANAELESVPNMGPTKSEVDREIPKPEVAQKLIDGPPSHQATPNVAENKLTPPSNKSLADRTSSEVLPKTENVELPKDEVFEPGRVLVIVGGRPILVGDLLQEINDLIEKNAQRMPENLKQTQRQMLVLRLLPKFVDRQLIYVDSVRGLPEGADLEQINESLGKAFDEEALPKLMEQSGASSAIQFDAQMRANGSSLRQYKQNWIEDQFVKYCVSQKMKEENEVSYQEMKADYDQHLTEFQFPDRANWEQLMVRFDRFPDRESARKAIAQMGNEVVYGASLDAVAKKGSHDFKASEGGQQGWVSKGSLAQTSLDKAIFELPLNQLSDVIETPSGLHIIRVLERTPAGAKSFRDAQVEIKEKLLEAKQQKRFEDYLSKLRREIPVEVVDQSIQLPDQYLIR